MKRKFIFLIVILAVCIFVGMQGLAYAENLINLKEKDPTETDNKGKVVTQFPSKNSREKGSPMHAWLAISRAGYKKGDKVAFDELRANWSASTIGHEKRSLRAMGVVDENDILLVDATPEQIMEINQSAIPIVNRTGIHGEALGIDAHRLDAAWLGRPVQGPIDIKTGRSILNVIRGIVSETTGTPRFSPTEAQMRNYDDFIVDYDIVPASVVINGREDSFTVEGKGLTEYAGVTETIDKRTLLASLVDARILPSEANRVGLTGETYDFSQAKIGTVLFKGEFVTSNPQGFKEQFQGIRTDETAVIISESGDEAEMAIRNALKNVGLLGEWGRRIIVMGVKPASPSAEAFARLFGDRNFYDVRGQRIDNILNNKDLVKALEGAV